MNDLFINLFIVAGFVASLAALFAVACIVVALFESGYKKYLRAISFQGRQRRRRMARYK